jgi:HTH-type transcriptional regulator / antitoxin HigA
MIDGKPTAAASRRRPPGRAGQRSRRGEEITAPRADYRLRGASRDSYLRLVSDFPLLSIRSEEHLAEVQAVMDRLLAAGEPDKGAELYLDALSDLVASYEDIHHAIEPASDADMLRHLMEAKGVTQAQLSRQAGIAKSTISEVLSGKRPFSRSMIRKLVAHFRVDASVLAGNL